jgi:ankyrin repeat protein
LMVAAAAGKMENARLLVTAGADINARNSFGWTPLMEAYFEGHAEVVAYLRGLGANLNGFLKNRSTADNWQGVR